MRNCLRTAVLTALALAAAAAGPPSAHAALTLTLHEDGYADKSITDATSVAQIIANMQAGITGDMDSSAGVINFSSSFGTFQIQGTFGTSNASTNGFPAQLSIMNTSVSTTSGGTLRITLTDTGFNIPLGDVGLSSQLSTTQLPNKLTVTLTSYVNGAAGTPITLDKVGGVVSSNMLSISKAPYTLSSVTSFHLEGPGMVQFTGLTSVTPEPGTLVAAFAAAPIFGLICWARRRKGV